MRARLAIALLIAGALAACASAPATKPYVGVFTGEYVDGVPLYRLPTIEVIGSRRDPG